MQLYCLNELFELKCCYKRKIKNIKELSYLIPSWIHKFTDALGEKCSCRDVFSKNLQFDQT